MGGIGFDERLFKKYIGWGCTSPCPFPLWETLTSVKSVQTYRSSFFIANFEQTPYIVHASCFSSLQGGDIQNSGKGGEPYMGELSILWGDLITS